MTRDNLRHFDEFLNQFSGDMAKSVIGFDRVFDGFRTAIGTYDSYPPYNVEKLSADEYRVSMALAGFKKDNIDVVKEGPLLFVSGKVDEPSDDEPVVTFLHQGIATRAFTRKIQLADDIEVGGASMKDGMLVIDLIRKIPEGKKAKTIKIK